MVAADEDALVCDFAEVYHIYDWRKLPVRLAAVYACGLPRGSRVARAMSGEKLSTEEMLLACIADRLGMLVWFQTGDGQKGRNRPASILEALRGEEKETGGNNAVFASGEEFRKAWEKIANSNEQLAISN